MEIPEKYKDRFKTKYKVDKNGCWIWQAGKFPRGYGAFHIGPRKKCRTWFAHTIAYRIHKGEPGKHLVLHKCNIASCVNPDHLYLGDQYQNMQDRKRAGNYGVGTKSCHFKYSEEVVAKIKGEYTGKFGEVRMLSKKYGVGYPATWNIVNSITWKHVLPHLKPRKLSEG